MSKAVKGKAGNQKQLYYRVSILDENKDKWFVRHAGISKERAEKIVAGYFENGVIARMSDCA